ncbi:MAG: hypothetical protein JWN82_662 [Candidatus Saccharibacteria bacterium]|nr:hypothetical protein [Candidatus Saccharibacteria bacterium]
MYRAIEVASDAVDRCIDGLDYALDMVTLNNPIDMALHQRTYRLTALVHQLESKFFEGMYEYSNKRSNK